MDPGIAGTDVSLGASLCGLLAFVVLLLLPGLLVVRAPWPAVPFLSLSFWALSWGWLFGASRQRFLHAALPGFLLLALLRLLKPLGLRAPRGSTVLVLAAAALPLLAFFCWPLCPGAEMSFHSLGARLLVWRDGLPLTYEPLVSLRPFGAHAPALPALAADVSLLSGLAPAKAVLLAHQAAVGLLIVALHAFLVRLAPPGAPPVAAADRPSLGRRGGGPGPGRVGPGPAGPGSRRPRGPRPAAPAVARRGREGRQGPARARGRPRDRARRAVPAAPGGGTVVGRDRGCGAGCATGRAAAGGAVRGRGRPMAGPPAVAAPKVGRPRSGWAGPGGGRQLRLRLARPEERAASRTGGAGRDRSPLRGDRALGDGLHRARVGRPLDPRPGRPSRQPLLDAPGLPGRGRGDRARSLQVTPTPSVTSFDVCR